MTLHADEQTRVLLLNGAELAAKGRELNFGPIQTLWIEIDADFAAQNIPPYKGTDEVRKQFGIVCETLNKTQFSKLAPKLLKNPANF